MPVILNRILWFSLHFRNGCEKKQNIFRKQSLCLNHTVFEILDFIDFFLKPRFAISRNFSKKRVLTFETPNIQYMLLSLL